MRTAVSDNGAWGHRLAGALALVLLGALIWTAVAVASAARHPATQVVRYRGFQITVPAGWPIFHLGVDSHVCVRFNRHAVYLGRPGTNQVCPTQAVGRTEAILLSPAPGDRRAFAVGGDRLMPLARGGAHYGDGPLARMLDRGDGVVVTATWLHKPRLITRALAMRSLRALRRAARAQRPAAARDLGRPLLHAHIVSSTSPATPGEVYQGLGFDTCNAPSTAAMAAWGTASPYGAVGVYIGGANVGCPVQLQPNLNAAWVGTESAAGWHLIPTYVGLQAPGGTSSCGSCSTIQPAQAAVEGAAAAQDAVADAQALGIGTGNPIYYDMEGYNNTTAPASAAANAAVLTFLQAWTQQLHASGYISGVYSSAASGITELAGQVGTTYTEPDDVWIADWPGEGSQTTADRYVPSTDWPLNQRLHQFEGNKTYTYGGVKISVDGDYLDGATAAAGSTAPSPTPSLHITASGDGTVKLTLRWAGEPGLTGFQILGGDSQASMTPITTVSATRTMPVLIRGIYQYFQVAGVNAAGQVLGTSALLKAPARVAVFGAAAFVSPRGRLGIPVACMNAAPCKVTAAIYRGKRLLTSAAPESVARHGGIVHLALGPGAQRELLAAHARALPARLSVVNGAGVKTKADITLIPYRVSGAGPTIRTGAGSTVRILAATALVSNGWVGGVPVACAASTPCRLTVHVTTRSGVPIATGRTPTVGAGEIAALHFQMTARGHALLAHAAGNQLAARVVVQDAPAAPTNSSGAATIAADPAATALVSLVGYH